MTLKKILNLQFSHFDSTLQTRPLCLIQEMDPWCLCQNIFQLILSYVMKDNEQIF